MDPISTTTGVLLISLFLGVLVFAIFIPIWAYKDADRRDEENPGRAAAIVFFGGPLGLIYWLSTRPPLKK